MKQGFQEKFAYLHNPSQNKDFPLIDPFFYDYGKTVFNRTKQLRGTFVIKNMTVIGANEVQYVKTQTKLNETSMTVKNDITLARFKASGWFDSDISVLEFPFNTHARFKVIADDISAQFVIIGEFEDNGKHFNVKSFNFVPTVKNIKFDITGFGPDKQLSENLLFLQPSKYFIELFVSGEIVNQFINQSWKPIYRELIKETKPSWHPIGMSLLQEIFDSFEFTR